MEVLVLEYVLICPIEFETMEGLEWAIASDIPRPVFAAIVITRYGKQLFLLFLLNIILQARNDNDEEGCALRSPCGQSFA